MLSIHNFLFPKLFLFNSLDPNGGLWINRDLNDSSSYLLGVSSIIAEKLEQIENFSISNEHSLTRNDIFLRLQGKSFEMTFFSPLNGIIVEINNEFKQGIRLTQESVYKEHWILKFTSDDLDTSNWTKPDSKVFIKYIESILKADKRLQEKCCPDFSNSTIKRRIKK